MTDIAARHQKACTCEADCGTAECEECESPWPCDAELMRRERDAIQGVWDEHVKECHPNRPLPPAAEADHAKALAEALEDIRGQHQGAPTGYEADDPRDHGFSRRCVECSTNWPCTTYRTASDALDAYDKDHER